MPNDFGVPVRVRVTPEVLYDRDRITSIRDQVLSQLGCPACCSGHDIIFDVERRFVLDKNFKVRPG
jgi:hypothetical protein